MSGTRYVVLCDFQHCQHLLSVSFITARTLYTVVQHDTDCHDSCCSGRNLRIHQEYDRLAGRISLDTVWNRGMEEQRLSGPIVALYQ
jgi:hypothetical protein